MGSIIWLETYAQVVDDLANGGASPWLRLQQAFTLLGGASHSHPSLCFFALLSIIFSVPYIERV